MRRDIRLGRMALGLACAVLGARAASAATIAFDGFDNATHPTGDRKVVNTPTVPGNNGIAFFTRFADPSAGTAGITSDAATGGTTAQVLSVSTATTSSFPVIGLLPAAAQLVNTNDAVTLTFRVRFLNDPADNNTNFRFGLHGSAGSTVTGDNQTASDNDTGYYVQIGDTAQTANNLFYRENGGTSPILAGGDRTNLVSSGGPLANGTFAGITDQLAHTVSFTLTRTNATTIGLSLSVDGGTAITASTTGLFTSLDEVSFSNSFNATGAQLQFAVDDVKVDSNNFIVPEPTGLALAGVVGVGALARRRRR